MCRELFHVKHTQAGTSEDVADDEQREVAVVLVIDGVERAQFDQSQHVLEFDRQHSTWFQECLHTGDEVMQVRDVRQDIVRDDEVGGMTLFDQSTSCVQTEEFALCRHAILSRDLDDICRGVDPTHRDTAFDEMFQQVAVVACDLDHLAIDAEPDPLDRVMRESACVLDPGARV